MANKMLELLVTAGRVSPVALGAGHPHLPAAARVWRAQSCR
jgi:hypothetical protein